MDLPHVSSRRAVLAGALSTGAVGTMLPGAGAVDDLPTNPTSLFFLQIGAIPGDSISAAHPNTIDVLTWSVGADTTISPFNTGSGLSKSKPRDFTFIARMGSHSPLIHAAVAKGTRFAKATLWARRASSGFEYLVITLENVYVTSYALAPSDSDAAPLDVVRLDFGKITHAYKHQTPTGTIKPVVSTTFDYVNNVAG
jgi:type VI secretion system secreted protein Hcp